MRYVLWLALVAMLLSPLAAQDDKPKKYAVKAGKILTMDKKDTVHDNVILFVSDGRIERIAPIRGTQIPDGYEVIDATDNWLVPGLIDCHNHIAGSLSDLNDTVWLTNPGIRSQDVVAMDTENMRRAIAAGVTTVLLIPGSGSNMGGFGTVVRTTGANPDEATLRAPGSLKIAQAGNPEGYWFGVGRTYMNYNLRQTLQKAKDYDTAWKAWEADKSKPKPEYNPTWDDLRGLFAKNFPVSAHTQIYQVFTMSILMLHDYFGIKLVPDHCTFDSFKAASLIKERDMYVIVGPRVWWQDPQDGGLKSCAGMFWKRGVERVGINTDAPVVPQEELTMQAAMSVHFGFDSYPALKGLTRIPAEALGVDDIIGTIEVGKMADFCLWTGDPIDSRSSVEKAFVVGKLVYDASEHRKF